MTHVLLISEGNSRINLEVLNLSFAFMCYLHVNYIFWVAYDRIFMYNQSC